MPEPRALSIATDDDVILAGEDSGEGAAIVVLHGLTATRRYVLMGSRALQRSGHRVIAYDGRGHGRSAPAPDRFAYGYQRLAADLEDVLDAAGVGRAVLAGASMGAHTIAALALARPERVAALALITPAFDPDATDGADALAGWDALARGLREGGVEGFLAAYDLDAVPGRWRETVAQVIRQRLSAHEHPGAVADALEAVPRSRPFERIEQLGAIAAPTVVIASRDEADPGHPLAIGERYAQALPGAELLVEQPGQAPLAWQGAQVSRVLAELSSRLSVIAYNRMSQTRTWDGQSYDRISGPMASMGLSVLDRMTLEGDETVLDAGCGSGRVTEALAQRLPRGRVIALDASQSMLAAARERLAAFSDRVEIRRGDLLELELDERVDAIFSTATFHWIADHDRLFARLHAALRPGGRLVAQCGGEGNITRLRARALTVLEREPYAAPFEGFEPPWNYAGAEDTHARLLGAGFVGAECWLAPAPQQPQHPREFLSTIVLGPHVQHLPEPLREPFLDDLLAKLGSPVIVDYVRLNIDATA